MLGLDEQKLERRWLARNEVLFRQGEKVTAIYFVEAGRLRLERQTFDASFVGRWHDIVRQILRGSGAFCRHLPL
jgi:CRP-like cAMP-binding protein